MSKFRIMQKKILLSLMVLFTGLVFLFSCTKQSGNELEGLMSITVTPEDTAVALGQDIQFRAFGLFADNTVREITADVEWGSSPAGKVSVNGSGYAAAIDTGATYVTAGAAGVISGAVTLVATPAQLGKIMVIWDYETNYLASAVSNPGWTGDVTTCKAGINSAETHKRVLQRINYFRRMVGLPDDVSLDSLKNLKCQEAALMMQANNELSHSPPNPWSCWTQNGADAAASSNLALGMNATAAITGYMQDVGATNVDAGHRRWILFSKAKVMGEGSTSNAHALWVFGNGGNPVPAGLQYIAYPPKGYVPAPLVFARWSLGVPDGDFTTANVTMLDKNAAPVNVTVVARSTGYGDNSIVWEPSGVVTTGPDDAKYTVNVTGVLVGGSPKTYSYDVIIMQVSKKKSGEGSFEEDRHVQAEVR